MAVCPYCGQGDPPPASSPELGALSAIARDVVRRLNEVSGEVERPSEAHSIAVIATENARRVVRWIDQLSREIEKRQGAAAP